MFDKYKRQFLKYLDDFSVIDNAEELLDILSDCSEYLPNNVCESLDLPFESTYADAVALLREPWGLN
ncbi:MAG: hypothetical protein H6822_25930 [Planctomycetaceae bacterium]|nr:hypothetical protein [Planctomycetaceae bacterium]